MTSKWYHALKSDLFFTCALFAALVSFFFGKFSWQSIDYKVILSLFSLMLLIRNFENLHVLSRLAAFLISKVKHQRSLLRSMILLTFFGSMLLTNDIVILSLLPVYLTICKKVSIPPVFGSILLIITANLGSSLFPFGNPQNLYLYSYYQISLPHFFIWTGSLAFVALMVLLLLCFRVPTTAISVANLSTPSLAKGKVAFTSVIALFLIAAILGFVPYYLVIFLCIASLFLFDPKQLLSVDYALLVTFLFFFIAVGNFSQIKGLSQLLQPIFHHKLSAFVSSAFISQFISNVPAAILIAPFSNQAQAVLLGVNIGGLGTLIASFANLIGYRVFHHFFFKEKKQFFRQFTLLNFALLVFFLVVFSLYLSLI